MIWGQLAAAGFKFGAAADERNAVWCLPTTLLAAQGGVLHLVLVFEKKIFEGSEQIARSKAVAAGMGGARLGPYLGPAAAWNLGPDCRHMWAQLPAVKGHFWGAKVGEELGCSWAQLGPACPAQK